MSANALFLVTQSIYWHRTRTGQVKILEFCEQPSTLLTKFLLIRVRESGLKSTIISRHVLINTYRLMIVDFRPLSRTRMSKNFLNRVLVVKAKRLEIFIIAIFKIDLKDL